MWTLAPQPTSLFVLPSTLPSLDEPSRTGAMLWFCVQGQLPCQQMLKAADFTTWMCVARGETLFRSIRRWSTISSQTDWISTQETVSTSSGLVSSGHSCHDIHRDLCVCVCVCVCVWVWVCVCPHWISLVRLTIVFYAGSNTHNNGNPGGDGQTGDAGEGRGGTDRNNMVEIADPNTNYPVPWENATLFRDAEVLWASFAANPSTVSSQDLATAFASSGYYHCVAAATCAAESVETKARLQQLLNNASPSFEGAILRFTKTGTYHYICSRNNNFTNRSQKGQLTVSPAP